MSIQTIPRQSGSVTVIDVRGRLTLGAGGTALRDLVHVLVNKGQKKLVLNLGGVDFIDSFGIGELTRSYASVRKQGGELKLLHVTQKVYDLLEITRLSAVFDFYSDEEAALRSFNLPGA